jgi:hypothetical protein
MSQVFDPLDYSNYVMKEHERSARRAHQARLARGDRPAVSRVLIGRVAAAVGDVLVAVGRRLATEQSPPSVSVPTPRSGAST